VSIFGSKSLGPGKEGCHQGSRPPWVICRHDAIAWAAAASPLEADIGGQATARPLSARRRPEQAQQCVRAV